MNIEPLKNILELSNNQQDSIVFFLNDDIKLKLNNYYLYEKKNKDIFINQFIICIKKNNLLIDVKGKIISIDKNIICININNIYNKYVSLDDHYTFLKNSRNASNDRDFFENLLQNLG